MKIQTKVKLHNFFEIKVIRNGEIIQEGIAENIVLNRGVNLIANFSQHFTQIVFGSGTGELTPTRTTLFQRVGSKTASTVEMIKSFPVSKVTKSIRLLPSEFVGVTFTEVATSEASTEINTHALIKDSEGNLLSITKTDIDILDIYATVFIEIIQTTNEKLYFYPYDDNSLLNSFINGGAPNAIVHVGGSGKPNISPTMCTWFVGTKNATRTTTANKVQWKVRFETTEINTPLNGISEYGVQSIAICKLPQVGVHEGSMLYDIPVGYGDDIQQLFPLPDYHVSDLVVKVNGNIVSDYVYNYGGPVRIPYNIQEFAEDTGMIEVISYDDAFLNYTTAEYPKELIFKRLVPIENMQYALRYAKSGSNGRTDVFYTLLGSNDLETWTTITSRMNLNTAALGSKYDGYDWVYSEFDVLANNYTYIKMIIEGSYHNATYYGQQRSNVSGSIIAKDIEKYSSIKFTTPVAKDAAITANYKVPYLPKNENYFLDLEIEIEYGAI